MAKSERKLIRNAAKKMLTQNGYVRPNKLKWHAEHKVDIKKMAVTYLMQFDKKTFEKSRRKVNRHGR